MASCVWLLPAQVQQVKRPSLPIIAQSFLVCFALLACERSDPKGQAGKAKGALPQATTQAPPSVAAPTEPKLGLELVAQGFHRVTDIVLVPGENYLALVLEQTGLAHLIDLEYGTPQRPASSKVAVVELPVNTDNELGLLSLAFHPDWLQNGRLFVHYNPAGKQITRVSEFKLMRDELGKRLAREARMLFEVEQPYNNHNGGQLVFGPDRMLYLGLGDGGAAADPQNRSQNLATPLGKILRFDVDGKQLVPADNPFLKRPGARPEIFAYGLRNPWKIGFAPDGRLIVADVGQERLEEIDVVRSGDNLGWRMREGTDCFNPPSECVRPEHVDPIYQYGRELGGCVTGGTFYTGSALPWLRGQYVFGDFLSGRLFALTLPAAPTEGTHELPAQASVRDLGVFEQAHTAAFGRDGKGEVYVSDFSAGKLYRLVAEKPLTEPSP
jgi:glucose/arabinose dehydrogenase